MTPQFTLEIEVAPEAIDELGHVNNAVYLQYVEAVARAHSESTGLTTERMIALGGVFVVRRHEVTYYAPAHVGDVLQARTRIADAAGVRATREVELWRGDERLAAARTEWVYVDPVSRRPRRMPAEVVAMLPPDRAGA